MARAMSGIEHRNADSVLSAFTYYCYPNFAIFSGSDLRVAYADGNMDEGREKLREWLDMISANQTSTVYTLKVYPATTCDIRSKTEHSGSTTFKLNEYDGQSVKTDSNGNIIMLPAQQQHTASNARLDKLEQDNRELQQRLYDQQLQAAKTDFSNQIAGLRKELDKPADKDIWDRIGNTITERPEIAERISSDVFTFLNNLLKIFGGPKENFIQKSNPVPGINGTNNNADMTTEAKQVEVTEEGAYKHFFLTDQERKLKKAARFDIMKGRIDKLTQEQKDEQQMACIEVLENRIGASMITLLLLNVASLNDDDLNDIINHMR